MIELWEFQKKSVDALREGIREGNRRQVLCSPTGSGKTTIGAYLLQEALNKGTKAAFLVDLVSLCGQTSTVLWDYGIQHGMAQSGNTFGRDEPIQVCSAQTIEKRGFFPDMDLLIVDECHTQRKYVTEFIKHSHIPVIGLSATPFTKGLGETYSNVVNVTTTNELIEQGYLAPLKVYCAKEIDMRGAKLVAGEWSDREVENRGRAIIGDIVSEWIDKTAKHFGGPVKTIAFSATVDHGAEICRQFQAAGYAFEQISYKDGNDERRAALIKEFRKPDSSIVGLVSCEALAKGFDVPDVLCEIVARPYRKSFSSHIQLIGRAMRRAPGKEFALLLDHAGNYLEFLDQMEEFFANGVRGLSEEGRDNKPRKENVKEKTDIVCVCGFVLQPSMDSCPSCGKERVRKNRVENLPGVMVAMEGRQKPKKSAPKSYLDDKHAAWQGICLVAIQRKKGEIKTANKFALAQYRNFYGEWPAWEFNPAEYVDPRLESHITHNVIKWARSRKRA